MFLSAEVIRQKKNIALLLRQSAASAQPAGFLEVLDKAMAAMKRERERESMAGATVTGGLVQIRDFDRLAIISDLHGDTGSLFSILDRLRYEEFLSSAQNKLVFLGDYVDRGSDSVGILYSVCYLKQKYPDSVVLMRGNHEAPAEFPFAPHDLPYNIEDRFGGDAKSIYDRVLSFFRLLTLATIVGDRLLLVHGGLPTDKPDAGLISTAHENHVRSRVMEELLWNDPRPIEGGQGWEPSRRGIGRYFGRAITDGWLAATNTKVVVRGHEPCRGYRVDHGGKILTLFSCTVYRGFDAAYLHADRSELPEVKNADDLAHYVIKL